MKTRRKLAHDPLVAQNAPAFAGFLLALLLGLRAVAAPEAGTGVTGKPGDCATTQPELRELFPVEMRVLGKFEGLLSDTPYRQGNQGLRARSYLFNANTKEIRLQMQETNDVGDEVTGKAHVAKVCKIENGLLIKAGDMEIPLTVLSATEVRMKINQSWYPFSRVQKTHVDFLAEGERKRGQKKVVPPIPTGAMPNTGTGGSAGEGTR